MTWAAQDNKNDDSDQSHTPAGSEAVAEDKAADTAGSHTVSSANNDLLFNRGIDNGQYPQPKSILVGLQVAF